MATLSICIPTYNRSGYLYHTLKSIVDQKVFQDTDEVEVVISDNCSTDLTQEVSELFARKYPSKIIYSRNEVDIGGEKNFMKALNLAGGKVLNLHNDNYIFRSDSLENMLAKIHELEASKPTIVFSNKNSRTGTDVLCEDMDSLLSTLSCSTTWISSFSIWKEDFDNFKDFDRRAHMNLIQVDVLYRMIDEGKKVYVFDARLFEEQFVTAKGGYNLARVFGDNYLTILEDYLGKGLSKEVYEKEKKFLLMEHIIPTRFLVLIRHQDHVFLNDGFYKHLIKHYRYNPYFYTSFFKIFNCLLSVLFNKIGRRLNPKSYQKYWRKRNGHNNTFISENSDERKIYVGNESSGMINLESTDNPNELLIIEDNVQIGENVKFILGENPLIIIHDKIQIPDNSIVSASM